MNPVSQVVTDRRLLLPAQQLPMTFVDVETTGLNPRDGHRICEVALVQYESSFEVARFCTLINPEREISSGAAAVNGITSTMLRDAPHFAQVAEQVHNLLSAGIVVAHNAPFDLGFLSAELLNAGLPSPDTPVIDTLAIARRCFSFPSNSLGYIAARLGIVSPAHRALSDVLTTRAVLQRFIDSLGGVGLSLGHLLERQGGSVPWPRQSQANLAHSPCLDEAVRERRRLRLSYRSPEGTLSDRMVDPVELLVQGGREYLVAFCNLRQEQRTFRVDRIVSWETERV